MTVVKFTADKVTKNAVRFTEDAEEGRTPTMGTVYLQKAEVKAQGVVGEITESSAVGKMKLEVEIKAVTG